MKRSRLLIGEDILISVLVYLFVCPFPSSQSVSRSVHLSVCLSVFFLQDKASQQTKHVSSDDV